MRLFMRIRTAYFSARKGFSLDVILRQSRGISPLRLTQNAGCFAALSMAFVLVGILALCSAAHAKTITVVYPS
jgi:hypothetical protein